jgi:hypothetical protein
MRCLGRLIGLSLVFTFMVVFPCSMWTFNTQRIVLDGDTYQRVFKNADFYADIQPNVLPALLKDLDTTDMEPGEVSLRQVIEHLDSRTWDDIVRDLVPLNWVKDEVETNLDSFLAWLNGDQDLELIFHTEQLRRRLAGPQGDAAVQRMADSFPACAPDAVQQFAQFVAGTEGVEFPYCQSPADPQGLVILIDNARQEAVGQIPVELNVVEEMRRVADEQTQQGNVDLPHDSFSDAELNRFRSSVRLWKQLLPLILMIPAALLSIVVIVAVRSSKTFFRWMGWALVLGSLATLLPLFFLPFIAQDLNFQSELEGGFAAGGALIAEVIGNRLIRLLVGQFTWPILEQSALLIVVGFVSTVISVLVNDPDTPPVLATPFAPPADVDSETRTQFDATPPPSDQGDGIV